MFRSVFGRSEQGEQATPQSPSAQYKDPLGVAGYSATGPGTGALSSLNPLSRQQPQDAQQQMSPTRTSPYGVAGSGVLSQGQPSARKDFPELDSLSNEELQTLMSDPAAYTAFLHTLDEVKQMDSVVDDLQRSNHDFLASTVAMEGEVNELQTQCRIIRSTELASAREHVQQLRGRQQEVYNQQGPPALVACVQEAAQAASKESEELKQQLEKAEIDVATFVKEFQAKRKLYHMRYQTAMAARASLPATVAR